MSVMKEIVDTTETIVRHLVCEEIREFVKKAKYFEDDWEVVSCERLYEFLEKVEKGE